MSTDTQSLTHCSAFASLQLISSFRVASATLVGTHDVSIDVQDVRRDDNFKWVEPSTQKASASIQLH